MLRVLIQRGSELEPLVSPLSHNGLFSTTNLCSGFAWSALTGTILESLLYIVVNWGFCNERKEKHQKQTTHYVKYDFNSSLQNKTSDTIVWHIFDSTLIFDLKSYVILVELCPKEGRQMERVYKGGKKILVSMSLEFLICCYFFS